MICPGSGQVAQKALHAWFLEQHVALLPFTAEAVSDEFAADLLEQRGQLFCRRGHVDQHVVTGLRRGGKDFLADDRRKDEGVAPLDGRGKKREHQVRVGMRRHHSGQQSHRGGITLEAAGQRDARVGDGMLVVNGNHGQALVMANVAAERLKVSDHQINVVFLRQTGKLLQAAGRARRFDQVAGHRALVAHAIVYIGEPEPEDFRDRKALTQVAQPAVKRDHVQLVSLLQQVRDDFLGARGVTRAFAVDTVKNVGHVMKESISFAGGEGEPISYRDGRGRGRLPARSPRQRTQTAQHLVEVFRVPGNKLQAVAAAQYDSGWTCSISCQNQRCMRFKSKALPLREYRAWAGPSVNQSCFTKTL